MIIAGSTDSFPLYGKVYVPVRRPRTASPRSPCGRPRPPRARAHGCAVRRLGSGSLQPLVTSKWLSEEVSFTSLNQVEQSHTGFGYHVHSEGPHMVVLNFVLFCIRQCQNSDRKVLPSLGLGRVSQSRRHKPYKEHRFELRKQNNSRQGKRFFQSPGLQDSIPLHHANELTKYCYNSSPFRLVLDR
jgi:hypothetical protein